MPFQRLDATASKILVQMLARALALYGVVQGVGILLGGSGRWDGVPALELALAVPGAPPTWGVVILVLGVACMVGTYRSVRVTKWACYGIGGWGVFFALSLIPVVLTEPHAATTGPPVYFLQAFVATAIGVAYRQARPQ